MATDLEKKIIQQIEYYFGDFNLPKDKFLQGKIKEDDGWVTLEVLLTFKRLASLSTDQEVIANAIKKSENKLVVLHEDGKKIRRSPDCPLPELNEERQKELMTRTAYAKGFPLDEKLDDIMSFLEQHGPIESCLRRTYLDNAAKEHKFKGSCFIIFKDVETCKKFIEAESIKYKDTELIRKWQKEYKEEKKKEIEERKNTKKQKKEAKEAKVKAKPKLEMPKGATLHFTGIKEDQTITREEIKEKIKEFGDIGAPFLDFSKGDVEGYVRMSNENDAIEFHKKLTDGKLECGEVELKMRVLEGEEEEEYLKKTVENVMHIRQKNKYGSRNNRKRRGNFSSGDEPKTKK